MSDGSERSRSPATSKKQTARIPQCARCRNHNLKVNVKGHKRFCKYYDCMCSSCILIVQRQDVNKKQIALRRSQDEAAKRKARGEEDSIPRISRMYMSSNTVTSSSRSTLFSPVGSAGGTSASSSPLSVGPSNGEESGYRRISPAPTSAFTPATGRHERQEQRSPEEIISKLSELTSLFASVSRLEIQNAIATDCGQNQQVIKNGVEEASQSLERIRKFQYPTSSARVLDLSPSMGQRWLPGSNHGDGLFPSGPPLSRPASFFYWPSMVYPRSPMSGAHYPSMFPPPLAPAAIYSPAGLSHP